MWRRGASRLPGGSGPITEIRAGFLGFKKEFFPAPGGTLITTKAVGNANSGNKDIVRQAECSRPVHHFVSVRSWIRGSRRHEDLRTIQKKQVGDSNGGAFGRVLREAPILEAPGYSGVGRFGWADQHTSLLSFSADVTETRWALPLLWLKMTTLYSEIRWTTALPTRKTRERNLARTWNCLRASCAH